MRKYENVDVIATLGAVMEINTEHYKSDFQYDKQMFLDAAANPDGEINRLLWLSRPSGTNCYIERDTFLKESGANISWKYHADTKDSILAYAVEISGIENGRPIGTLYELDYRRQVEQLNRNEIHAATVKLKFEDGTDMECSYKKYDSNKYSLQSEHGKITAFRLEPENADELRQRLSEARNERQKYNTAVFKVRTNSRKPSILAELKAAAETKTAPKKAAAKSKNIELE